MNTIEFSPNPTTLQTSKQASKRLGLISTFSGLPKNDIVEGLIADLFQASKPQLYESVKTGDEIAYKLDIKVKPKIELVNGSFPCNMATPREETDRVTYDLVTKAFERLDNEKAQNRVKFKKALEELA